MVDDRGVSVGILPRGKLINRDKATERRDVKRDMFVPGDGVIEVTANKCEAPLNRGVNVCGEQSEECVTLS